MKQIVQDLWQFDEIGEDVNCYVWQWAEGLTLIDAGYTGDGEKVLSALVKHGHPIHTVRRIIITHAAPDHCGGLHYVKQATRGDVVCHAVEKEFLEHPLRRRSGALWAQLPLTLASLVDPAQRMRSVEPDVLVVDGQKLPEGFTVVHTPGAAPGHIALLHPERRLLIAGDALSNRGGKLSSPSGPFVPDSTNAAKSIWKLAKKYGDVSEIVVFGHGPPISTNGGKRITALASQIFSTAI